MEKKVLADAYTFLARKKLTEFELIEKLSKKGHDQEAIDRWLPELRELGYLNDQEVVEGEVRRGMLYGHGPIRVAVRLAKRMGINFHDAREQIDEKYAESDQIVVARKLLEKKKPPREKLFQTLYSRGFSDGVLQHFLSTDINN